MKIPPHPRPLTQGEGEHWGSPFCNQGLATIESSQPRHSLPEGTGKERVDYVGTAVQERNGK